MDRPVKGWMGTSLRFLEYQLSNTMVTCEPLSKRAWHKQPFSFTSTVDAGPTSPLGRPLDSWTSVLLLLEKHTWSESFFRSPVSSCFPLLALRRERTSFWSPDQRLEELDTWLLYGRLRHNGSRSNPLYFSSAWNETMQKGIYVAVQEPGMTAEYDWHS